MLKHLLWIIVTSIFILIGIFFLVQRNLIYFPDVEKPQKEHYKASDMHEIKLTSNNNVEIFAWYKKAESNKPTILYLHGNAGNIGNRVPIAREFMEQGYGFLLLEYTGYSGNKGTPSEKNLYVDARAALNYLHQDNVSDAKIVLFGESLGSSLAIELATKNHVCALVLQSPFTSLKAVARFHYPIVFVSPLDKYNNLAKIPLVKSPVMIAHGEHDEVVPYSQGKRLFSHANQPKKFVSYPNGHHNDTWGKDFFKEANDFISASCN